MRRPETKERQSKVHRSRNESGGGGSDRKKVRGSASASRSCQTDHVSDSPRIFWFWARIRLRDPRARQVGRKEKSRSLSDLLVEACARPIAVTEPHATGYRTGEHPSRIRNPFRGSRNECTVDSKLLAGSNKDRGVKQRENGGRDRGKQRREGTVCGVVIISSPASQARGPVGDKW